MREINQQLKDLISTMNSETRKSREEFALREEEHKAKIAELSRALILQEKKMIDKVIEGIDIKHQTFNQRGIEDEMMARIQEESNKMRGKRREILEQLEESGEGGRRGSEMGKSLKKDKASTLPDLKTSQFGKEKAPVLAQDIDLNYGDEFEDI